MSNETWNMNDEAQMPLGTSGDASTETGFGTEGKSLKINSNWLVLGGVFAAGLALVFALGKQAGPRAVSAEQQGREAQFQQSLAELAEKAGKKDASAMDTEALVQLFKDAGPATRQGGVAGNPFELPRALTKLPDKPDPTPVHPVEDPVEAQRLLKVAEAIKAMKVQTIMYSKDHSAALIGKDFVQVGSRLGDFTVVAIEPDRVVVEANNEKYQLKLVRPGSKE